MKGPTAQAAVDDLACKPLADIEKQVILTTLQHFKGHRVKTAGSLGIGVRTLGIKLKKWKDEGDPAALEFAGAGDYAGIGELEEV